MSFLLCSSSFNLRFLSLFLKSFATETKFSSFLINLSFSTFKRSSLDLISFSLCLSSSSFCRNLLSSFFNFSSQSLSSFFSFSFSLFSIPFSRLIQHLRLQKRRSNHYASTALIATSFDLITPSKTTKTRFK